VSHGQYLTYPENLTVEAQPLIAVWPGWLCGGDCRSHRRSGQRRTA